MTPVAFIRKLFSAPVLAATASLWLAACMGGTGTDTENGIQITAQVVGSDGAPQAQVDVQVLSLYAGPEAGAEDPLMPETGALHTDSAGFVHFTIKRAGRYMAQGQRGDTVLLLDTLTASANDTLVFHTAGVQRLRGKVRLYSGYQIDTGFVFLRGSRVAAAVSRTGDYDLGYVPITAGAMTLGAHYNAQPASQVFVKVADAGGSIVTDSRFTLDTNLVPAGGANLTLLKASQSTTNVCFDNAAQTVVPGVSIRGSIGNASDIKRAASFACSQKVGAKIQVNAASLSGNSLAKLGDYVLPDAEIWPTTFHVSHGLSSSTKGQKIVVPTSCLQAGTVTNFTTTVSQDSTGSEIRVDDIGLASGCEF